MAKRRNHERCAGHFTVDGFTKKLCYQDGPDEPTKDEAWAFAVTIAELAKLPVPRLNGVGTIGAVARPPVETWANRPYSGPVRIKAAAATA